MAAGLDPPSALTAKGVGALEGDVDGEVPDQRGGRDAALGGDLGDSLLQTLQGMWGEPGGAAGQPGDSVGTGWGQGAQGLYRRGDPVLPVDKGELAVEIIEPRELQEREREERVNWEFTGNFWG